MSIQLFQVDSFTNSVFKGNPAGVCITPTALSPETMQNIAREMALSETAFITLPSDANQPIPIRYFTPTTEVPLCGHATLATAHILWSRGFIPHAAPLCFKAHQTTLNATWQNGMIAMQFPKPMLTILEALPPWNEAAPETRLPALSLSEIKGWGLITSEHHQASVLILELISDEAVKNFTPNIAGITALPVSKGLIITSKSHHPDFDIVSRFFAPKIGIAEDPATGVAHTALAAYWENQLGPTLRCYQASLRGGVIQTQLHHNQVTLTGQAITVFKLIPQF